MCLDMLCLFLSLYNCLLFIELQNYKVIHVGDLTRYVAHGGGGGGSNTATRVLAWLQLLNWPVGDQPEHANDPSIVSFELVVN